MYEKNKPKDTYKPPAREPTVIPASAPAAALTMPKETIITAVNGITASVE
jgi:hypothetical protein